MHTVFALLCFVVVIHWLIFPYPSGLLHWHCGNLTIAPVPAKQPWWIWINTSCEFIMNDCITTTKQSTTKPCAYFLGYTISYPMFADADTGIYPHATSQYLARPKAKRGIAMLNVVKYPYPRKETRGNEFIPCSNNICDILKRFRSFKIPAITLIWPKSSYKDSVTRSYRSGNESGRRSESPLWRHQWRSFVFISHADDVIREIRLHISRLLTNQKRESARSMG